MSSDSPVTSDYCYACDITATEANPDVCHKFQGSVHPRTLRMTVALSSGFDYDRERADPLAAAVELRELARQASEHADWCIGLAMREGASSRDVATALAITRQAVAKRYS